MTLPKALCTIVIPCRNAEHSLEKAVRSVLAQSFKGFHIVIVDECSSDGTKEIAQRLAGSHPQITFIELSEDQGRAHARNRGLQATQGPFVATLDVNDTYHSDFLGMTMMVLSKSADLEAVRVWPSISDSIQPTLYDKLTENLVSNMLIRRAPFDWVGGFPEGELLRQLGEEQEDIAFVKVFSSIFNTGVLEKKLYNVQRELPGLFTAGPGEADPAVEDEMRRLLHIVRRRMRDVVVEHFEGKAVTT